MRRLITVCLVLLFTSTVTSIETKADFDKMGIASSERKAHPRHPRKKIRKRYIENNQKKKKVKTYYKGVQGSICNFYMVYSSDLQKERAKNLKKSR